MPTNDSEVRDDDQLAVFSALWACAAVLHVAYLGGSQFSTLHGLLAGLALATIAMPWSTTLLLSLALVGPVTAWIEAPFLGSHWQLAALIDLAIMISIARARSLRSGRADVQAAFRSSGKLVLSIP